MLQAPLLSADDYKWDLVNALTRGETEKIDQILNENIGGMSINEKRLVYGFVLNYSRNENTLRAMELLLKYNIHPAQYDLYNAISNAHTDRVVDFILDDGIRPNGEILLLAAERQRWDLVRKFVEMGVDVNYRYPSDKSYADGMTALIYASKHKAFEMVKLLVEHGADINLRTNTGGTAAAIAYENGETEIYNYLKEHGALDFIPGLPQENPGPGGTGISTRIENGSPSFRNGTYRLSGSAAEIKLMGNNTSGYLTYKNNRGNTGNGIFRIAGSFVTITMEGSTFTYRIDTNNSFSGNGETWVRIGD
ncbi:MAG: ankyrin repeat domain-containing protein [Treponema sp.]|nr:ankyrin repeat domain-containing protein [Treponema sp.]